VASITTKVTFSATSQSRSSSSAFVVVANVRMTWLRERFRLLALGVRTHAFRSIFPISKAAHRSCSNSTQTSETDGLTKRGVRP
jgi:hypothetical protein